MANIWSTHFDFGCENKSIYRKFRQQKHLKKNIKSQLRAKNYIHIINLFVYLQILFLFLYIISQIIYVLHISHMNGIGVTVSKQFYLRKNNFCYQMASTKQRTTNYKFKNKEEEKKRKLQRQKKKLRNEKTKFFFFFNI